MIAFFLLALSFALGLSLLRIFRIQLFRFEGICAAFLVGSISLTWFSYLFASSFGFSVGMPIAILILLGCIIAGTRFKRISPTPIHFSKTGVFLYIAHTLFWSVLFLFLLNTHMLQQKSDGIYSGGNTWGDLALHATFIEKFASQPKPELTSPIYAQEKTTYPFLFDFYTSLLYRYGLSIQLSLIASSGLFLFVFLQLSYFFIYRVVKSHLASFLFPFIFLLNGGVGVYYFFTDWMASGKSFLQFLYSMPIGYANLFAQHIYWSNLIADYLLPQRSFIPSLGLFTLFLTLLYGLYAQKKQS